MAEILFERSTSFTVFFTKTLTKMFVGLLISAVVGYATYASGLWITIYFNSALHLGILFGSIATILLINFLYHRLNSTLLMVAFYVYAALFGLLSGIYPVVYGLGNIYVAFALSALMFGGMVVVGHTTKVDLTKFSSFFLIGLIMLIVTSLVAVIFRLSFLEGIICFIGIVLFLGITAFDVQRFKELYRMEYDEESKLTTMAALHLYMDFINIFIYVLRFLGRRD